jgi:Tfp pilus assembly protein PilE
MQSLRSRLTLTHTLAALVAVVIVAALTTVLVRRGFDRLAVEQGQRTAGGIAAALERYYAERGTLQGAPLELRRRIAESGGSAPRRIIIVGPGGR